MKRVLRILADGVYGLYASAAFITVALPTAGLLPLVPGLPRRRSVVRSAAGMLFQLAGAPVRVSGLGNLPDGPCIVVANHASNLDGIILTAALPPRFGFVIKSEMARVPLARGLLRRIDSQFVDRFDPARGARDARRILQKTTDRQSLTFFPEGTFAAEPGLRRFHAGAFMAAARSNVPVVPVVIRGSRRMLPARRLLPRPGRLEVLIRPPVHPSAAAGDPVQALLEHVRRSIVEHLDEPDLAPSAAARRPFATLQPRAR